MESSRSMGNGDCGPVNKAPLASARHNELFLRLHANGHDVHKHPRRPNVGRRFQAPGRGEVLTQERQAQKDAVGRPLGRTW